MSINDGGPAFPSPVDPHKCDDKGMTLRDYFAAKVMQGMFANHDLFNGGDFHKGNFTAAYEAADAMLRAREQSK